MLRIGQLLPDFRQIAGAEERAARLMTEILSQPDGGIYELLLANAYRRRGWENVSFMPEARGVEKRHDLLIESSRSRWAAECKRAGRSGYARDGRLAGERIGGRAHELSRGAERPLIVLARYKLELVELGDSYLAAKVERFLDGRTPFEWSDEGADGVVMDVDWRPLHRVMSQDDVYFGSSRMCELLVGEHSSFVDSTTAGDWEPAEGRPLHATWVNHVSMVAWLSLFEEAARRKAVHFRGLVARAARQLPGDCPGAVHVGYEAVGGNSADGQRHELNRREMRGFDPGETGLRMVYGNYFTNELVTSRDESAAVSETTASYPVGGDEARGPLPGHMLFVDENGTPGSHLR